MTKKTPLTPKHKLFCLEYVADPKLNATQAYIRAGYSPKTAEVCACQLLRKPKVQAEIKALMSKREKKLEITSKYVLKNIKEIAESCKQDGNKENQALKGFELLGRHLKMFTDKVEVSDAKNVVNIFRPGERPKKEKT